MKYVNLFDVVQKKVINDQHLCDQNIPSIPNGMDEEIIKDSLLYVNKMSLGSTEDDKKNFLEETKNVLEEMKELNIITEEEEGLCSYNKPEEHFINLTEAISREVFKKPSVKKIIVDFAIKHRNRLLKMFKKREYLLDVAFSDLLDRDTESFITYLMIFLCCISEEEEYQDFLFGICKRIFKNVYREVKNVKTSNYLSSETFFDIAMKNQMHNDYYDAKEYIYHYFAEKEYEKASFFVVISMHLTNRNKRNIIQERLGIISEDYPYITEKRIKMIVENLREITEVPESINSVLKTMMLKLEINNKIRTRVAIAIEKGKSSSSNKKDLANAVFCMGVIENWKAICKKNILEFLEKDYTVTDEETVKEQNISTAASEETQKKLLDKIEKLTKKLNSTEQNLIHIKAEKARTEEKLQDKINELNEIITMHERATSINEMIEENIAEDSFEEMVKKLNQYKCMVVGGHDHWIKQMKEYFPDWVYWTSLSKPIHDNQEYDAMIFYPKYIGHSLYNKFAAECKAKEVPRCILNHANIQKVTEQIFYMIEKKF